MSISSEKTLVDTLAGPAPIFKEKQEKTVMSKEQLFDAIKFVYILYYRHGMNAGLQKNFYYEGDLIQARKRAEEHCRIMNYHFIFVRPLIVEIETEEDYQLGRVRKILDKEGLHKKDDTTGPARD